MRTAPGLILALALVAGLTAAACEEVGAPEAYRTQVCSIVRSLAGPMPAAVQALTTTAAAGDSKATLAALDAVDRLIAQMNTNLVDVPLWQTGAPAVADLKLVAAAYTSAAAAARAAATAGDATGLQAALAGLANAGAAGPKLGDDLRAARVKGLNC